MNIENTSIFASLGDPRNTRVTYVQPQRGPMLVDLHTNPTADSPAAKVLAMRLLLLSSGQAIPFHVHHRKEKIYILVGNPQQSGSLEVIMYEKDELKNYFLTKIGESLVIPPGTPHAIVCRGGRPFCQVSVITSSQDATDIQWEPGVEILLENEHLKAG